MQKKNAVLVVKLNSYENAAFEKAVSIISRGKLRGEDYKLAVQLLTRRAIAAVALATIRQGSTYPNAAVELRWETVQEREMQEQKKLPAMRRLECIPIQRLPGGNGWLFLPTNN